MCSIATNATAETHLKSLASSDDEDSLAEKLKHLAGDSTVQRAGYLDLPMHHMHGMPSDLKHIRRVRTGRHRTFYTGHHSQCSYTVFYIKKFKKTGVKDELDKTFHRLLKGAVNDRGEGRTIRRPDPSSEEQS